MSFLNLLHPQSTNRFPWLQKLRNAFVGQSKFSLIMLISLIIALSVSVIFYQKYAKLQRLVSDPSLISKAEADKIISKVSRLMTLPEGEYPTVATVADLEQLKDKPFFDKAKQGDKVLIYTQAKKAILYDPIANKIIDIAPVDFEPSGTPTPSFSPSPVSQVSPTIAAANFNLILYNGSDITGLTKNYEEILKEKVPQLTVIGKSVAKKRDYEKTILIDLKGNPSQAQNIAQQLDIRIQSLPADETASPSADFLIILGADKSDL